MPAEEAQRRADAQLRALPTEPDADADGGDQEDVVGSGLGAAVSSFAFFASGAAVPVLPFLVGMDGTAALLTAAVLVGLALLLTGATVGMLSGGPPLRRGLRQLGVGAAAAGATYVLGLVFGATVV